MRLARLLSLNCLVTLATAAWSQTLTCSSDDMGRHFCRANTSNGVQLVHQRSGSPCTQGASWGYDSGGIWVDHGCRADFVLGGSGGQSPGQPSDALRACKNAAGERLPQVPLAYISVYRGTDPDPYNYMINFRAQPPNSRANSGFCIVSRNGQVRNFQFDLGSGGNQGGGNQGGGNSGSGNSGGQSAVDVMRACKNAVSGRLPSVPLAYIQVNQPRVNGGSMLSTFRTQPPNGPYTSGSCDVFKNGRVNLSFDGGR
jgi:hypothetical protein